MANTANTAQPQIFINYISQRKKIIVNEHNQPSQLLIQTDYYLNDTLYFKILNVNNQIVQLDSNTTYQLYGTFIDSKKQVHVLFSTLGVIPTDNTITCLVNTYTSQYLAYVKNNQTPIDISIVAKQTLEGGKTRSYMVLRDKALANPRGYLEGQAPTDIVYQNIFNANVPVTGSFGAGNDINLAEDPEGEEVTSFAFGDTLSTNNANQFVIGYNNEPDATKAFIVANSGNIFTVDYEGNVEAGDLNVGAISATSITVSGEDLNQVIDEKVEYLSTSVDDKLSATSAWVSDTFETKESATQTFNELEGEIDDISAFVSGLPTAIAAKADQTDLETLSCEVQTKAEVSALNDYVQTSEMSAYATSAWVDENYALKTDVPTNVYTKTETDEAISAATSGKADLSALDDYALTSQLPTDYTTSAVVSAIASAYAEAASGTQYKAGEGLALSSDQQTFYLTAAIPTGTAQLDNDADFISGVQLIIGSHDETTTTFDFDSEDFRWDTGAIFLATNVARKSDIVTYTGASGIAVDDTNNIISISGQVGKTYTAGSGIAISNENEISLTASIPTSTSQLTNDSGYTTSANVSAIVTGYNYLSSITFEGYDYQDESISIPATGVYVDQYSKIQISENSENQVSLDWKGVGIEGGSEGVEFDAHWIYFDDKFNISNSEDGASISLSLSTSQLTNDSGYATTTQVSSIVTGYGYQTAAQVSAIASAYAGGATGDVTSAQVSAIVEGYNYITGITVTCDDENWDQYTLSGTGFYFSDPAWWSAGDNGDGIIQVTWNGVRHSGGNQNSDSDFVVPQISWSDEFHIENSQGCAQVSLATPIPLSTSQLTNDSGYTTSAVVSAIASAYAGTATGDVTSAQVSSIVESYGYQTASDVSGIASAVASTYISTDVPTKVSELINDVGYITNASIIDFTTSAQVSAIASAYAGTATGDVTSAQVSAIVEGYNYATETELQTTSAVITALIPNSGTIVDVATGAIPTNVSNFTNDAGYQTASNVDDKISTSVSGLLSAGTNVTLTTDNAGVTTINATGGTLSGGTNIEISNDVVNCTLSAVSDLTNDVGYLVEGDLSAVSEFANDIGYLVEGDLSNKQVLSSNNSDQITYDSAIDIFNTVYTVSNDSITLNTVTVPAGSLGVGEVATFEEWIYTDDSFTTVNAGSNVFIGEVPSSFTAATNHVFVRRLVNNGGTITQYVSFAYEVPTT